MLTVHDLLQKLPGGLRPAVVWGADEAASTALSGLALDSRKVAAGNLFAALPSTTRQGPDGYDYIPQALEKGAVAFLLPDQPPHRREAFKNLVTTIPGAVVLTHSKPRLILAKMAAAFFASQPSSLVAVTGTNGKTSVATFVRQLWQALGVKAASLGTLGLEPAVGGGLARLTTPDSISLHQALQGIRAAGINHLALEASSHGLEQYRLDGLKLSAAAFTNLSLDHLDYHETMAAYFAAKKRLFLELLPEGKIAVINNSTVEGRELSRDCRGIGQPLLTYGADSDCDLILLERKPSGHVQEIALSLMGHVCRFRFPLVGAFQIENLLCALGLLVACGEKIENILPHLKSLKGVAGRLENMGVSANGGAVYVDYAHTPDALETVITALRPHCKGKLVTIIGCGGERDRSKRPVMGATASRLSDLTIVTDDNPRSEDPASIRRDVLGGSLPHKTKEVAGRGEAITMAVSGLEKEDLLLIAGKGHETGQIIGDNVLPLDDRALVAALLSETKEMTTP